MPFEVARTRLRWGQSLAYAGRYRDARLRTYAAHDTFRRLGAAPWQTAASAALAALPAADEPDQPRSPADLPALGLSALHWRMARGVARGMSNEEIGAEVFLSRKTVEAHLSRIYRTLGIRGRPELAVLVARLDPDVGRRDG